MTEAPTFSAGIVDFSTRRMTAEQADEHGIPPHLRPYVADLRQYPLKIGELLPEGTVWFRENQPWYFRAVMGDAERVRQLQESSVLILSGSGMSAFTFQEGGEPADPPHEKDREYLERAGELVRDHLGAGKWVLGDCFGGQFAMHAVGATLGRLPDNQYGHTVTEAGYLEHHLTPQGRNDEVFGHLPESFYAAHFHSDFVATLPQVGSKVATSNGEIEVVRAEVLAIRNGYLDRDGLSDPDTQYIHGAVIEFSNGARLYHTQPHPEMSTPERANFFARHVGLLLAQEEEMGAKYAQRALEIPEGANYYAAEIITKFADAYKKHVGQEFLQVVTPAIIHELKRYAIQ